MIELNQKVITQQEMFTAQNELHRFNRVSYLFFLFISISDILNQIFGLFVFQSQTPVQCLARNSQAQCRNGLDVI